MPTFQVTDPQGRNVRLTGDSPPSEQELEQIFAQQPAQPVAQPVSQQFPSAEELISPIARAGLEPLRTVVTGAAAEPVAGLAGLATLPFGDAEKATENIEAVRQALTAIPQTPEAMQALQQFAQTIAPVVEPLQAAERQAGEAGFEEAGPIGGAIGTAAPTAALIALGVAPVRRVLGLSKIASTAKKLVTPSAKKLLSEAAPTTEGLKQAARGIYNELDDVGATVNPSRLDGLSKQLQSLAKKQGFNKRIHPKVSAALDEIDDAAGRSLTVSEIDTLRKVTRAAAKSIEPDEARLGSMLIDKIDDFLDDLKPRDFVSGKPADVGPKFKDARQLWQRAKKSELLEDVFERAQNQATGFENGLRTQFRSIINSKKKSRGLTSEELDLMRKVVRGGPVENTLKALGKFGFSEGQATNMLMGSLGVAGGAAIAGPAGAVAVPLIGQVSKSLAQKLTRNNAIAANTIAKAGKDGIKIANAYIKAIPKTERNVAELTELLLRPEVSLKKLKNVKVPIGAISDKKLMADAAFFAAFIQSQEEQ